MFIYSTENLISSATLPEDNVTYRSTEDLIYQVEYLYNYRPSKPFRFTAKAAEWIKIDLGALTDVSLLAIFNHNLTSGSTQQLDSSAVNGAWALVKNITYRLNDEYITFTINNRWFRYSVADAANPNSLTIGEMWLGNWSQFANAKVQSPRGDGPQFWTKEHVTPFGQDHDAFLSENETFSITLMNINAVGAIDDIQTFLTAVYNNGNRFVMIPDSSQPHVYFCKIMNKGNYATRLIYGSVSELRNWRLEIKTLTRGITLL